MKTKTFSNGLIVKHRRSGIILENANGKTEQESTFNYTFTPDELENFVDYILKAANEAWANITPKLANSMASDYDEYYDKKYDNNGYLSITRTGIVIEAPHLSTDILYQFNKTKIQSFIYDLQTKIKEDIA